MGDVFQVSYSIADAPKGNFIPPDFSDFQLVSGPSQFSEQTIVNGRRSSVSIISYGLMAKEEGTFRLDPARYQTSRKVFESNKLVVKVQENQEGDKEEENLPNYFAEIELDTSSVYIGQQVEVNYVVYSLHDVSNFNDFDIPSLTGFWKQDNSPKRINPTTKIRGGKVYRAYKLRTYTLFPQRQGELLLDGINIDFTYRIERPGRRGMFRNYQNKKGRIKCEDKILSVYPVPEKNKPDGYSGGVGTFRVSVQVDPTTGQVGEAMNLKVSIVGEGNIMLISPPEINLEDVEIFDPEESENIYEKDGKVMGSKTFAYSIIPKKEGDLIIPPQVFHYYQPETGEYRAAKSRKTKVKIRPGDPERMKKMQEQQAAEDIGAIVKQEQSLSKVSAYGWMTKGLGLLLFLAPFAMIPVFIRKKKSEEAEIADVSGRRKRGALGVAKKRLEEAQVLMNANKKGDFYDEIIKAIYGFLADRADIKRSESSQELISTKLSSRGIDESRIKRLHQLIDYCEMALYAPVPKADDLKSTYEEAINLVGELEENIQ